MTPMRFVTDLSALSFSQTFNPYREVCSVHDLVDAPHTRFELLASALEAASLKEIDAIWIGRDLGHRGGRRTGLAFTDDVHLQDHLARWGTSAQRPTKGAPLRETTAKVVWNVLEQIKAPIFLWNVFPLHPHEGGKPFSNRLHNAAERRVGMEVLDQLVRMLRPRRLVAVGNDAEKAAQQLVGAGRCTKVRHPSYGGQTDFLKQVRQLYTLTSVRLL